MQRIGDDVAASAGEIERRGDQVLADGGAGDEGDLISLCVDEAGEEVFGAGLQVAAVIGVWVR